MQTSLKIDRCRFTCYNVSYGQSAGSDNVEGPGPEFMSIRRSEFLTGRGAGYVAQSGGSGPLGQARIQRIHIEDCTFHAPLNIAKARSITLVGNRFHGEVGLGRYETLEMRDNTRQGQPFSMKRGR